MRNIFLYLACLLCIISCKSNTDITAEVTEVINVTQEKTKQVVTNSSSDMKLNPLVSYFPDLPFELYENCHEEKGASEDFFKGNKIPTEVASEHRLYKISSVPKLGMKRKVTSEDVEFRAIGKMKANDASLLFYTIGINCRTDKDDEALAYETRVLVYKDEEVESNYFVGGHKSDPINGSMSVCRNAEVKNGKLVLTLNKNASLEVPSILRMDDVEEREI